ncbi:MAG: hypothetical protein ACR2FG_11355, partial [Marmoricola sp.]
LALAFDSVTAVSAAPLRIATGVGFIGAIAGILAIAWSVYGWLGGVAVPGWTSILATTGLIGAIQLICLGLLGEYVARLFVANQGRPSYVVGYDSLQELPASPQAGEGLARLPGVELRRGDEDGGPERQVPARQ